MVMTPDEIENHGFSRVWRGYDPAEVDDFLKEVAVAQAQAPRATPSAARADRGHDDFQRLGEEVAAVLRQTNESVATLRRRAEADAALIRQNAEGEAAGLRQEARRDRRAAAVALEAAHAESARVMADIQRRLEGTRQDIDQALGRLVEEDEELIATIDRADPARGEGPGREVVLGPEPSPPTPVSPPIRTTPTAIEDLPYAEGDDDLVEEPADLAPVVDLTDSDGDEWLTAFEDTHPA